MAIVDYRIFFFLVTGTALSVYFTAILILLSVLIFDL